MKVSAVAFALTALLIGAVAQVPTPLPICAASCLKGPYSSCNPLDLTCVCSALVYAIACCIPGACNQADQDTTFQFAENLCASDSAVRPPSNCATSTPTSFSTSRSTSTSSTSSASGAVTQVPGLPSCAEPQSCIQLPPSCNPLDVECICAAQAFHSNVTCCVTHVCNQPSSTTSNVATPTTSPGSGSSSNSGAIAGGTVGGIAVVGGLILVAWVLIIKRRQLQKRLRQPGVQLEIQPEAKPAAENLQSRPGVYQPDVKG